MATPPKHIDSPLAWTKGSVAESYIYNLSDDDKADVKTALAHFKGLELDGSEVAQSNFPLPKFSTVLEKLTQKVHQGRGFVVIRGLNPRRYSSEDNILLFLGISSYIGELRAKQDHRGSMLMHICDAKQMETAQKDRPARDSNTALDFHTDLWANILALQTLGCAAVGGNHVLSPGYTIYNELAETQPDVIKTLMAPDWTFDPNSLHADGEKRPLLYYNDDRLIFNFGRLHVTGEESSNLSLSKEQSDAMQALQATARKYQLVLPLQPGDLLYVNNYAILHAREAFEDSDTQIRHLVRLWLKNEALAWNLPPTLQRGNDKLYHDPTTQEQWDITPPQRVTFDVRDKYGP